MAMESQRSARRTAAKIVVGFIVFVVLFSLIGGQTLNVWLNILEFGELYIKPFYFSLVGGLFLSFIAFFRLDFISRKSLTIWLVRTFLIIFRGGFHPRIMDFNRFRLSLPSFLAWQFTKTLIGVFLFSNALFGMSLLALTNGWDAGLANISRIFSLPFTSFGLDDVSGAAAVVSAAPALILLLPPVLGAIAVRLTLLVGVTNLVKVFAHAVISYYEEGVVTIKTSIIEFLISLALAWTGLTLFFSSYIDYNTKVYIIAAFLASAIFAIYGYIDMRRRPYLRSIYLRVGLLVILALAVASFVTIQNSIADAQKLGWRGPYVRQEIEVNSFLADLKSIVRQPYNFSQVSVTQATVAEVVDRSREILSKIRLWDWEAAFTKLRPEIGLIPYVDFEDSDIIRFNNTLFWSASLKPVLPPTVTAGDRWYNEHLVYTHIPQGFLMLDAHTGEVVDPSKYFKQRRIYYGEGGTRSLFELTWAAIIDGREGLDEIDNARYSGGGGVKIGPPLTWLYDVTFFLSYPDRQVHLLRYRDVHERVALIMPYFTYTINEQIVDMFPVSDGERSYWLLPLIVALPTNNVPWSNGNSFARLTGFAVVDTYDGSIRFILTGDDFFTSLFEKVYSGYVSREVPEWLRPQVRYPAELFQYRVEMFNIYHIQDPAVFIQAREFYEIPSGLEVYYVVTRLPNSSKMEFLGLLSLEVRGARGLNLAGYMVVRNEYPQTGEMIFYRVDPESPTKLLGPSAALQALQRDPDYRTLSTLLASPRVGEIIFYEIDQFPVYFIPVYTAREGEGVVTQLGTIAAIGASFTGQYFVGLGNSAEEAFRAMLLKMAGLQAPPPTLLSREEKIAAVDEMLKELGVSFETPSEINSNLVFKISSFNITSLADLGNIKEALSKALDDWKGLEGGILIRWESGDSLNLGVIYNDRGLVVLRYISIGLG
ncbi:hypothetical protein HRbin01_00248 [archaeon HR01]|nr:hypothetical protein HRbin01_00248 [archaeon HR01]